MTGGSGGLKPRPPVNGGPLRILYLIDSLAGGGAERSLAALAPAYRDRDLRLTVAYLHERPGVRAELEAAGARAARERSAPPPARLSIRYRMRSGPPFTVGLGLRPPDPPVTGS